MFLFRKSPKKQAQAFNSQSSLTSADSSMTSSRRSSIPSDKVESIESDSPKASHVNWDTEDKFFDARSDNGSQNGVQQEQYEVQVEDETDNLSFENQPPFLYYESIAQAISYVATTARISLRAAGMVADTALETAKFGTSLSLGIGRTLLVNALYTARNLHLGPSPNILTPRSITASSNMAENRTEENQVMLPEHISLFHQALDRYTSMSIGVVNSTFSLAELFTLATFHLTTKTVKFSIRAAEETVRVFDGLFGSTETSRALAAMVAMVRQELIDLNNGQGVLPGRGLLGTTFATIATLGGLTKALTAYACLQHMTAKRTHELRRLTTLYEGIVSINSSTATTSWRNSMLAGMDSVENDDDDLDVPIKWAGGSAQNSELQHMTIESSNNTESPTATLLPTSSKSTPTSASSTMSFRRTATISSQAETSSLDSRSFIEEASDLRKNIETLDDAASFIEEATSMQDDVSLYSQQARRSSSGTVLTDYSPFIESDSILNSEFIEDEDGLYMANSNNPTTMDEEINVKFLARMSKDFADDFAVIAREAVYAAVSEMDASQVRRTQSVKSSTSSLSSLAIKSGQQLTTIKHTSIPESRESFTDESEKYGSVESDFEQKSESSSRKSSIAQFGEKIKGMVSGIASKGRSASQSSIKSTDGSPKSKTRSREPSYIENIPDRSVVSQDLTIVKQSSREFSISSSKPIIALSQEVNVSSRKSMLMMLDEKNSSKIQSLYQESISSTASSVSKYKIPHLNIADTLQSEDSSSIKIESPTIHSVFKPSHSRNKSYTFVENIASGEFEANLNPGSRSNSAKSLTKLTGSRTTTQTTHHHAHLGRNSHSATTRTKIETLTTAGATSVAATEPAPSPSTGIHKTKLIYQHFPNTSLLNNFERYVKFASGSYGRHFMKVFGIGRVREISSNDPNHHANHYAFSIHTGIPLNCIASSSYTIGAEVGYTAGRSNESLHKDMTEENDDPNLSSSPTDSAERGIPFGSPKLKPLIHYVVLDHERQVVVLTLRGTLGLSDLLHDALFKYVDFEIPGIKKQKNSQKYAHGGMARLAKKIAEKNERNSIFASVRRNLEDHPTYGLVLCGHSLGGGVAALVSILWSCPTSSYPPMETSRIASHVINTQCGLPPGRPIHCYSFGSPSCVSDELANGYCKGLVSSIINGDDLFPSLSLGLVRDLKSVSAKLLDPENKGLSEKIIGRALGIYQNWNLQSTTNSTALVTTNEDEYFWSVVTDLRKNMVADKLYPPGVVYWIQSSVTSINTGANSSSKSTEQPSSISSWLFGSGSPPTQSSSSSTVGETAKSDAKCVTSRVQLYRCEDVRDLFGELRFSQSMLSDHTPKAYEDSIEALYKAVGKKNISNL
ncbi:hypothetical protein HK096_000339 [Nowakowskiella sp. JEL0078]|nr:hypothetical protein HK096_000339 [Nowakowskiella sp. JEL0078]